MSVLVVSQNGIVVEKASLAIAVSSPDAVGKAVVVRSPQTITANVVVPSTIALRVENGGVITIDDGKTLTLNGSFSADDYQCFAYVGSGHVIGLAYARPEWFGRTGSGDQVSINAALNAARSVELRGAYTVGGSVKVPSYTKLYSNNLATVTVENVTWSPTDRKVIVNLNPVAGDTDVTISGIHIIGAPGSGGEHDAGIHLTSVTDGLVENNVIYQTRGDGITLGRLTAGVVGTCYNVAVRGNTVDDVRRQGIALTEAYECVVGSNTIKNLLSGPTGCGSGIDLETDTNTMYMWNNRVVNNTIRNCATGIILSSVVAMPATYAYGNVIADNTITHISHKAADATSAYDGIRTSYYGTVISGNVLGDIYRVGINVISGAGLDDCCIIGNVVRSASIEGAGSYPAIQLSSAFRCAVTGNLLPAASVSYAIAEVNGSANNVICANNYSASGKTMLTVASTQHVGNLNDVPMVTTATLAGTAQVIDYSLYGSSVWYVPQATTEATSILSITSPPADGTLLTIISGASGAGGTLTLIHSASGGGAVTNKFFFGNAANAELGYGGTITLVCRATAWFEVSRSA